METIYEWVKEPFLQTKRKTEKRTKFYYAVSIPYRAIREEKINPDKEYHIEVKSPKGDDKDVPYHKLKFEKVYTWEAKPFSHTYRILNSGEKHKYYCFPIPVNATRTGKINPNKEYLFQAKEKK
jgi:hypothetical protein